jgi:hypothetical protein
MLMNFFTANTVAVPTNPLDVHGPQSESLCLKPEGWREEV